MNNLIKNNWFAFSVISVAAIVWNILTMHNFLPWCDEVMLTDAPAHMLLYGEWKTNAFNAMGDAEPYANGLYWWVLYIWLSIFGLSFYSVRMFSLVITICVAGVGLKFIKGLVNGKLSLFSTCIFSVGFWFSSMIALDYRMARYDMLGCLLVFLLANVVLTNWRKGNNAHIIIILISAGIYMAGIQAALYVVLIYLFALLFIRPFKKMLPIGYSLASGLGLGFFISCCVHGYTGHLMNYIFEIINASGTLQKLWAIAREYILPLVGREVKPLPIQEVSDTSLSENILRFFDNPSTIILVCVALLLIIINKPVKCFKEKRLPILLALFSILVVIFFNLAGRYPVYYRWTAVIPMIGAYALWCEEGKKWINRGVVSLACLSFTILTLSEMGSPNDDTLDRINAFVDKQNFKQGDRIATVFSTYYAIKPKSVNSYWYEIYPTDRIGELDYIIVPDKKRDKADYFYPSYSMIRKYSDSIINDSLYEVQKIDSMLEPCLTLYSIKKK